MARILLFDQGKQVREIPITRDATRIGRERLNHVHLADKQISRFHAEIQRHGYLYSIEDKQSTNGTRLNGRPLLARTPLAHDDTIQIGPLLLVFQLDEGDQPEPLTPAAFDAGETLCAGDTGGRRR